jgi:CheY-like chemotaxis protein
VLLNLVGNAIKFTPSGGQITLEVKQASDFEASSEVKTLCPPGGDYVLFAVTDTGIGIKEEEQAKLFRKFQQVDSGLDRHFGGVGLGLVISKGFVESHGGAIWLASRYKHGAKFQFAIPLKPVPVILVVDDEKNIVEVIARLLAGSNYHVLKASDGVEALAVVAKAVPDLIIMDIKMPRMDGYQLVKSLKSEERTNKIPILILSGYTVDTGLLKACGLNLFRSIAKPFDSGELLLEVEMILRGE